MKATNAYTGTAPLGLVHGCGFYESGERAENSSHLARVFESRPKTPIGNVLATNQFVVNVPPFEREILEKVRVVGLEFPPTVSELEKAGLTAMPSKTVKPPRIMECRSHFECQVEWTKQWLKTPNN